MTKNSISFTTDILTEVAEEGGWDIEQVKFSYDLFLESIRDAIENEKAACLEIYMLGRMYLKTEYLKHVFEKSPATEERYKEQVQRVDDLRQLNLKKKEILGKSFRFFHGQPAIINKYGFRRGYNIDQLEEIQNNI